MEMEIVEHYGWQEKMPISDVLWYYIVERALGKAPVLPSRGGGVRTANLTRFWIFHGEKMAGVGGGEYSDTQAEVEEARIRADLIERNRKLKRKGRR